MTIGEPPYFPLVTAVMDRRRLAHQGWRAWFAGELTRQGFRVTDDGQILYGDADLGGFARFLEVDAAAALFGDQSWFSRLTECPWTGGVMGFFTWTVVSLPDPRNLIDALVFTSRGMTVRPHDGTQRSAVALLPYRLDALLERHGFADGDVFLDRDDKEYVDAIVREVNAVLSEDGLEPEAGFGDTHHNPLLIGEPVLRRGNDEPVDARAVLSRLVARLWTFDLDILRDSAFWYG